MSVVQSVETVFRLAVQVEEEGVVFYRKMARIAPGPAVRDVFVSLADDEARHVRDLSEIARSFLAREQASETASDFLIVMRSGIEELKKSLRGSEPVDPDSLGLHQALSIGIRNEEAAIKIYTSIAEIFPSSLSQVLFRIADEEKSHLERLLRIKRDRLG
jgi:rubrerythrin